MSNRKFVTRRGVVPIMPKRSKSMSTITRAPPQVVPNSMPAMPGSKKSIVLLAVCDYAGILWKLRCAINKCSKKYHAVQVSTQTNPFQYPIEIICELAQRRYVQSLVDEADVVILTDYDLPGYMQDIKITNFKKCIYYGTGRNYRGIQKQNIFDKYRYRMVSTPDLMCRANDIYLPAPIDTETLKPSKARTVASLSKETMIMHSPSIRGNKGTNDILASINSIAKKYPNVKYTMIEHCPNHKALSLKTNADIFLDQFGKYKFLGYNSIESSAFGSAVVLDAGQEKGTPALHATSATLYAVLARLVEHPEDIIKNGNAMRKWCVDAHGYPAVYKKLEPYLDIIST